MKQILTVVFTLLLLHLQAQQKPVSGVVKDSKGEPVPFATVLETGTKRAVQTDANGRFSIRVNDGARLTITSSGYAPQTVTASEGMTISLTVVSNNLNEVVVTALGIRRQPKELGYSVTKVSGDDASRAKPINVQNGLTGKVSGLTIQTTNNGVFADTRITLRGIRSLTGNNQALLVIDGSPMPLSLISTLNPNDVQDVTVLKGNTGAALYGQEGGNGVIIITTKSGNRSKPVISIGTTIQRETISFVPKFQKEYGNGESENPDGTPHLDVWTNNSFGPRYDGSEVALGDPLEDGSVNKVRYAAQSKSPAEQFFRPAITFQNDVSISGGDEKSRYYLSLQDVKVNGLIPKDENRRTTIRLNASREFGRLSTSFRMFYTQGNYNIVNQDRGSANNIYRSLFKTAAHVPITEFKDWRNNKFSTPDGYYNRFGWNPWMLIDIDRNKGRSDDLVATLEASYKIMEGFNFTYRLGTNVAFVSNKSVLGAINVSKYTTDLKSIQSVRASVSDAMGFASRLNSEAFLTYKKQINRLSVDGLVGYSVIQRINKQLESRGNNLIIPTLYNVSNRSGEAIVNQGNSEIRTTAVFGKLSFGWDNWAFLELTGRNEWDSRLNISKNSFFYPGGSLSLLLHEVVPQIKTTPISYLKLRGSWALSGTVNLDPYSLESTFSSGTGFPYGNLAGYSANGTINNPDIKPEFVNGKEVGFEIGFMNNRLMLEATAFRQDNTDQIIGVQVSGATGYQTALVNAASFVNKGLEFDLRLTPLIQAGKDFRMDLKANYTYSDNEVTSIYEGLTELGSINFNYAIVGMPAYVLKLTDFNRTPDGKVIVDRVTGLPTTDPVTKAYGRTLPKHLIGINPSFQYKKFSLSIVADYRGGHYVYHGIGPNLVFEGSGALTTRYNRKPFIFPNSAYDDGTGKFVDNTDVLTSGGTATFWTANVFQNTQSLYYTSAASWKLREVSLSYELPASILQRTRFVKSAVITVSGRNLFTWVPGSNIYTDPEFSNTTGNAQGVNNSFNTPPTRIYGASINLTF
ncbi:SusC/RagA family TonB-linked outer membrane protein [Pseudoflavitalea sp. X16]|uniref:SusC/RagA family TonB-linked outer membrane protein n=1 Tax=Paraflavitalea devenefica TaxID=2716334 RepID=UPI001421F2FA|nr:SusC/RagA family TonB-linked outer membrane protein [Paraflavitalea devenefica]NII27050.1 SusC/RagA family TonB-linked outer membrane protein [Paraflavitalea devenefica]